MHGEGLIEPLGRVIDWPGYRKLLQGRIASWTLQERRGVETQGGDGGDADLVEAAEWQVHLRYRKLLAGLGAEDDAGMAVWASRELAREGGPVIRAGADAAKSWSFLHYEETSMARARVLDRAAGSGGPVCVALAYEPDAAVSEVYLAAAPVRARMLEQGFVETVVECAPDRPAGLRAVERVLFRAAPGSEPSVTASDGLSVLGAPRGDAVARQVARRVRELRLAGVPGDDVLVLFRKWSEQAAHVVDVLRTWEVSPHADEPEPLQLEAAVSVLLSAARLPGEDWETEQIVRLLRNGLVCPAWPECGPMVLASAASILRSVSTFRGREPLLRELDLAIEEPDEHGPPPDRLRATRAVVGRLFGVLDQVRQARTWSGQAAELRLLARALGLDPGPGARAGAGAGGRLEALWDSLDDHALAIDSLGRGSDLLSWDDFVEELGAIAAEITMAAPEPAGAPSGCQPSIARRVRRPGT